MIRYPYSRNIRQSRACIALLILFAATMGLAYPASSFAADGWRQKLGTFRIGIVSQGRPELKKKQIQPFVDALQKALDIPVEIYPVRDHSLLIDALTASRIEYTMLSATAYAAAADLCKCVEPLAIPLAADGSKGFHVTLIARATGASSLADLRNKPIIVPGVHSFSGYQYPRLALQKEGVYLGEPGWPIDDYQSMEGAIEAFKGGRGSAILGWSPEVVSRANTNTEGRGTLSMLRASDRYKNYRILWKSALIPHGPHAVRSSLPSEAKVIVWEILSRLQDGDPKAYDAIEPVLSGGFVSATKEDFSPLSQLVGGQTGTIDLN